MYKIGIDAMGGDHAPEQVIAGVKQYLAENDDVLITLFGDETQIKDQFDSKLMKNISIVHTTEVIEVTEDPVMAMRKKKDSSLVVGTKQLKSREIDAFISAGSTGALVATSIFQLGRLPGVERPALGGLFPSATKKTPTLFIDLGANVDAKAIHLVQNAIMGKVYMQQEFGINNPKIGLLNIGAEAKKGNELTKEAYKLLSETEGINFAGNMEARDALTTNVDIVVMDGFSGNILLKTFEGAASFFKSALKDVIYKSTKTKVAGMLIKNDMNDLKNQMDYKEMGATPIFGVDGLYMKAHGSSDARAFSNSIAAAKKLLKSEFVKKIKIGVDNETN